MKKFNTLFRNGCIAVAGTVCASTAFAEGSSNADAAKAALESAKADVDATSPMVLMVVAGIVGVGVLISLFRKV
ncbi:major coat protein [Aeromonas bivalvium]|uniref:major coat protein n=1 Tax=Aeromonas bivalvium TaxID=440079 RepID=UPI0038D0356A